MATGSDKYYTLFNSIDEGYLLCEVIFDEAGRAVDLFHLEANPAANHILGMDLTGRRSSEFNTDDRESWYEMLGMVVITGESYRTERYSEPHQKWFDFYVTKIGDPDSRLVAIVFHDVTDRKRREAHLHFLSEVSREFSRLSSAEEIMQTIGRMIGEYLNVDSCNFVDVDESRDKQMTVSYSWKGHTIPVLKGTYRIEEFLTDEFEKAIRTGETIVICDTQNDERIEAAAYDAYQIRAFIVVPFFRGGEWKYFLSVTDAHPRNWREDETELFRQLANIIFPLLDKARMEESLKRSEKKYRSLFETMEEGFVVCGLIRDEAGKVNDLVFLELNPSLEKLTGLIQEQIMGQSVSKVLPGLDSWWYRKFQDVMDKGETSRVEQYVDPLKRWYDVTIFPQEEDRIAILYDDVTSRKNEELQLKDFNAKLEAQVAVRTKELREEQYFLEQITDNTPHLIYVFDFDEERFIYVNKRIQALTGVTQDYVYGMGPHLFKKLLHPDDLARRINYLLRLSKLNEGEIRENEFRLKVGCGYRWFRSKDHLFKKVNCKVKQVIGLAEDITYEILLQEKIHGEGKTIGLN